MVKIQNNFVNNIEFVKIQNIVFSKNFFWHITNTKPFILRHNLINEQGKSLSPFLSDTCSYLFHNLQIDTVLESYILLQGNEQFSKDHKIESEFIKNKIYKTFILVLDSSDGFLQIPGLKKIPCEENRALFLETPVNFTHHNPVKIEKKTTLIVHYL